MQQDTVKTQLFDAIQNKFGMHKQIRLTDIQKTLIEDIKGLEWNSKKHRGFYCTNICGYRYQNKKPYLRVPGNDGRYLYKVDKGHWELRGNKKENK